MKNASPPPGRHEPNENRVQEWKDEARAKISNLKKKLEQQKLIAVRSQGLFGVGRWLIVKFKTTSCVDARSNLGKCCFHTEHSWFMWWRSFTSGQRHSSLSLIPGKSQVIHRSHHGWTEFGIFWLAVNQRKISILLTSQQIRAIECLLEQKAEPSGQV